MAPADRAAITSSLSDISPPAMTGTFTSLHTLRITLGMSPGSISMMSGLATLICFSMFSKAMESNTKTRSVVYRDSSLARFLKAHPQWEIHICYGNTQTLLSRLREGTLDFAIVEGYFREDLYTTRILQKEPFIGVASSKHIFQKPVSCLRDLTGERLLLREHGSGTRAILTKILALNNLSAEDFSHIIEIENIHAIVSLLREDCGISFLYQSAVKKELEDKTLIEIPLSDFKIAHDFSFIWNKDSIFSAQYEAIFQELQK